MSCSKACGKSDVFKGTVMISNLSRGRPWEIFGTLWSAILSLWKATTHSGVAGEALCLGRDACLAAQQAQLLRSNSHCSSHHLSYLSETLSGLWKSRCGAPEVSQHDSTSCLLRCSSEIQEEVGRYLITPSLEHGNDAETELHGVRYGGKRHWGAGERANGSEIWHINE